MTKKHYEAIASEMRKHLEEYQAGGVDALRAWGAICDRLATVFAKDNARFDKARFLNACGWVDAWGVEAK
jgi:hypothetical protein